MSQHSLPGAAHPHLVMPMRGREPNEQGRAATPLELFFDLVAVVAIAFAAERMHHALVEGRGIDALIGFALVFFGVWWAWANFSWFASAYDTDDVAYRLSVFVIMTGALVLAAGVPAAFDERNFGLAIIGYVIMRIALVSQWLRVSLHDRPRRTTARRYAIGVTLLQVGWLSILAWPDIWPLAWLTLLPLELLVPFWAERAGRIPFHPEHITERYGLFMIIVLGESVLATSLAIQTVIGAELVTLDLIGVIVGGLLVVYSMWWIYFDRPSEHLLDWLPSAQVWNYVHLLIFGAVALVGTGLVLAVEETSGHAHLGWVAVGAAVALPLAVYLLALFVLYLHVPLDRGHRLLMPAAVVLLLAAVFLPAPVLFIGLVVSGLVAVKVLWRVRSHALAEDVRMS